MNRPEVSVLIPSYNHGCFIEEAVASVLDPGFESIEVVIVDDGSTDDTTKRLQALSRDHRVRVFEQENLGAHAALNRSLEIAGGEFLFILDSDDAFLPDRIPRLIEELQDHPDAAIAASWIQIIDADSKEIGVKKGWFNLPPWPPPTDGPYLSGLGDPTLALLETNFVSTTSNLAFHRSLVDEKGLGFQPLRYAHDWDFILSACHHGELRLVGDPLLKYRVHPSNTIKEGADTQTGAMRFEIQWVIARHALPLLASAAGRTLGREELVRLAWNSMPAFGCDGILDQLLVMRGTSRTPPSSFDALIDPSHPFFRSAVAALAGAG